MVQRQLLQWLKKVRERPQIVHIVGLRQTGKTTLMAEFRKHIPNHLHYPLQNYTILSKYRTNLNLWISEITEFLSRTPENEVLHVFVDEIQKIPEMFQALQGLYDEHKGRIKFWIWGSSARPLKKHRAETLAGRIISRVLHPLSQSEILKSDSLVSHLPSLHEHTNKLSPTMPSGYIAFLKKTFRRTLLPEPYLTDDEEARDDLLDAYAASYLENEIRRENLVGDIGVFSRFLLLAASENASVLNYSSLAKNLGVSSHTTKTYREILEDTYVVSQLPPFSTRMRVQVAKSPKVYFSDTGLARFVAGRRDAPYEQTAEFGRCFEGFVVNELSKQIEYQGLRWKLSYLRTKGGREADLVVSTGKQAFAVEIKSKTGISPKDYENLIYLIDRDPSIEFGVVICLQGAPLKLTDRIYTFPAWCL